MYKLKITYKKYVSGVILLLFFVSSAIAVAPLKDTQTPVMPVINDSGFSLSAQPITIDQIIHNKGNIVTTVDNNGYIGGYYYTNLPSGEWPRNSSHNYIGELKFWMGAVTPDGDTLVANSDDDFQAVPVPVNGENDYKIYLSTDSTRYYNYNRADTVGLGLGKPAYGWRVWDAQNQNWTYNRNFNSLTTAFEQGGPTSLQESHCVFKDNANGELLGLEISQTISQWNYCYNEDFLFVVLDITNTSVNDYPDFAIGLYIDIDVGGPDGTGENGRLEDLVAIDQSENLAWTYDNIGWDPGWGRDVSTGIMGTKYLETPDDIGMTAFRTDDWAIVTNIDDEGRYELINSEQFDSSLPPTDQFYLQCTNGIDLTAGKTVRVVFALIAGQDEAEFRDNADMAQQLYDNYYVGPEPPATPILKARAGENKVYLQWSDTSEVSVDPLSGVVDFGGYKLYRSDNQGKTWGETIYRTNNNCLDLDYVTLATFSVNAPGDLIPHTFIDTGLYNGVDYWYCLAAYDVGDTTVGVDPLQSGFGIADETPNIVSVTPKNNPAGYYEAAGTVEHIYTGLEQPSIGEVFPTVFDVDSLLGADYEVVFEDFPEVTYWHLINVTTGDTVLLNQTQAGGDPNLFDVTEGMRVVITNADIMPTSMAQTSFGSTDTTLVADPNQFYGTTSETFFGVNYGDQHYRSTYELRYTGDSTLCYAINTADLYVIPFECWNVSTNQRVALSVYDFAGNATWDSYDLISIVNWPYDETEDVFATAAWPTNFSWLFGFDAAYNPQIGDVFTIEGARLNGPDDKFAFKVDGINEVDAQANMKDIRVVPNPYFARYSGMVETSEGESILEFQKIPGECTIRIYTLVGDLIYTINHNDGTGTARWDLQSNEQRLIASGMYLYHIESEYGEFLGRFAVIK